MILVDSSALIDYYRPAGLPGVRSAVAEVIEADLAAINGVIQVEVLAFADVISYRKLLSDLRSSTGLIYMRRSSILRRRWDSP
jgi:transketolase C-terminal domain/subunit